MSFELFTPLFAKIDAATGTFISDMSSRAIIAITPFVTVGMTLSFIVFGLLILSGKIAQPVDEFLYKSLWIAVVVTIASAGGLYQSQIAHMIVTLPDELAQFLISGSTTEGTAAGLIDRVAGAGFSRAGEAFEKAGFLSGQSFALMGIVLLLSTLAITAVGGWYLLVTKVALTVLAGLGPIFLVTLPFAPTRRLFDSWLAQVFNYAFIVVLFSAIAGFFLSIFGNYMDDLKLDGTMNVTYAIGGAALLSVGATALLLQLSSIASGLAGGATLGHLMQMRAMRGAVGTRAVRSPGGGISRPGTGAIGIAGSTVRSSVGAVRTTAGYFRGRMAA